MRILSVYSLLVASTLTGFAQPTKIHDAIRKGIFNAQVIDNLTFDDIPEEWWAKRSLVETESNTVVTFSRNKLKVMEVLWSKRWVDEKSHGLLAVYTPTESESRGLFVRAILPM